MSLLTLGFEMLLALAKLLGFGASSLSTDREREVGAALQREMDMNDEQTRISAAARAGLAAGSLPSKPDPHDRDSAP